MKCIAWDCKFYTTKYGFSASSECTIGALDKKTEECGIMEYINKRASKHHKEMLELAAEMDKITTINRKEKP